MSLMPSSRNVRAQLREEESQIAALRGGALTNRAALQHATAERTLKAVDALWAAVIDCDRLKGVAASMSVIKFDAVSAEIGGNAALTSAFQAILKPMSAASKDLNFGSHADSFRPFISDPLWALFEAYRAIFALALAKAKAIESGDSM